MNIPNANEVKDIRGDLLTLRRLSRVDIPVLWDIVEPHKEAIFRWYTHPIPTLDAMRDWVERALKEEVEGLSIAFAPVINATGEVVGSTRFMEIDRPDRRLMIGSTWLVPKFQRTGINAQAKYLMLRTAFEGWKCHRVELRTDSNNSASRAAILSLGAKEEGTLRNHQSRYDGSTRHSVYFSIIEEEWPEAKAILERRIGTHSRRPV